MKNIAWGGVLRDLGIGKEILMAERVKKNDPFRSGQWVLPGGGLELGENYVDAAIREVKEETDIDAEYTNFDLKPSKRVLEKPNLNGRIDSDGLVIFEYLDSHMEYKGKLVLLYPKDSGQVPTTKKSDATKPAYIQLSHALELQDRFTPACQVLLDLIKEYNS